MGFACNVFLQGFLIYCYLLLKLISTPLSGLTANICFKHGHIDVPVEINNFYEKGCDSLELTEVAHDSQSVQGINEGE